MIAECAIEPEVMAYWRHFQSLHEDFGVKQARLICEFPGKWRKQVIERAGVLVQEGKNTELQRTKMIELMSSVRFRRKLIPAGNLRIFNGEQTWLGNACNTVNPFDIILKSAPGSDGNTLCADELIKSDPPFRRTAQNWILRQPEKLIEAAGSILRNSRELILVEPNFRADEPRFVLTLIHLFKKMEDWGLQLPVIELHTRKVRSERELFFPGNREALFFQSLNQHIPARCRLQVFHWGDLPSGGKLHPRFILTNIGGMHFDYGLDQSENEQTLVSTLEDEITDSLLRDLRSEAPDRHEMTIGG